MADCSSLVQNVKNDENVAQKFPYRILNDLAKKLKAAEDQLIQERKFYEAKIAKIRAENESTRYERARSATVYNEVKSDVPRDDASKDALVDYISKLKHEVSTLVYENNRYHLAISNCTMCTSDDEFSNASLPDEVSMIISTPVTASLDTLEPSTSPVPCPGVPSSVDPDLSRTSTPPLLSRSVEKKLGDSKKSKDRNFISRMVRTLTKLETKYQVPKHKRKRRLFTRKQRSSPVVPRELASIYYVLAAPEPEAAFVPYPFPDVRWDGVRFKPALPASESCPVYSCHQDPGFYQEKREFRSGSIIPTTLNSIGWPATMANLSAHCLGTRPTWVWWLSLLSRWVATCTALMPRSGSSLLSLTYHHLNIQLPEAGGQGKGELLSQGGEKDRRETRRGKREKNHTTTSRRLSSPRG